ncbi:hypothetical protein [Halalkalibacter lacteus]|uniref:hypothetical protein n=1 Tax=Halalkalibacter lacteus TaxID=3090663 RepID=UPI002FC79EC1
MEDKQIPLVTLHDVFEARKRISSFLKKSPFVKSGFLSEKIGANTFIKLETVNEVGSFKIRGATTNLIR